MPSLWSFSLAVRATGAVTLMDGPGRGPGAHLDAQKAQGKSLSNGTPSRRQQIEPEHDQGVAGGAERDLAVSRLPQYPRRAVSDPTARPRAWNLIRSLWGAP
ncbi:hypothetical protein F4778DRAFT_782312 [Xylariomycetidae sp. FL2044]|nr:hypothetical protein F4778DRAFT_782312 [Xylariomycetidae sp. FL2044]